MSTAQTLTADVSVDPASDADQYLTFMLDGEEYGVDILRVQEIKGWDTVTAIPNTPEYIKGVINLRGTIVPIIDLRERFSLESAAYGATTVVIVLKVMHEESSRVMGIVVDAVSDVYNVARNEMKPPPDFGHTVETEFIKGIATVSERMIVILDIDHLLNSKELETVKRVAA